MGKKTLIALAAGISIGAVLGILLAPDKGSNTRKKIVDSTGDLADTMKKQFSDLKDKVKNTVAEARGKANDMASEATSN